MEVRQVGRQWCSDVDGDGVVVHVMGSLLATSAAGAVESGRALSTELVATDTDSATSLHTSMATVDGESERGRRLQRVTEMRIERWKEWRVRGRGRRG